jgi:hypothetical protein
MKSKNLIYGLIGLLIQLRNLYQEFVLNKNLVYQLNQNQSYWVYYQKDIISGF